MTWDQLTHASFDTILAWATDQPWCWAMADCHQDAGWHPEGDVWTHTKMVCTQLLKLDEWPMLNPWEHTILLLAALFHDAGKPLTSHVHPGSGRITSPRHAEKGERLCRSVLRGLGCDVATREGIARLVRFHSRPAFLLEKPNASYEVVWLSWLVNNRLLYLLALADTRGRTSRSSSREENLALWQLACEENDCFTRPYKFANDHARFVFYRQAHPNLHAVPFEDFHTTVTLMSGLPGSGKDTWLAAHRPKLPVVSLDAIRHDLNIDATDNQGTVIQLAQERCRQFLRSRHSFAFNATNLLRQTRDRWINLFADYGARIEVVYVEPPLSVVLAQNSRRAHLVPAGVIHDLMDKLEPPTLAEAHSLILDGRDADRTRR